MSSTVDSPIIIDTTTSDVPETETGATESTAPSVASKAAGTFTRDQFMFSRNKWLRLTDHLGITGSTIKPRWRLNAELARFALGDPHLDQKQHDLINYAIEVEERDVDSAWTALSTAKRISLAETTDEEERRVLGRALRVEAQQKLTGWRQATAAAAIGTEEDEAAPPPTAATLVQVQQLIDEHNDNRYRQLAIHARSLRYIGTLVVSVLIAFGIVIGYGSLSNNGVAILAAAPTLGSFVSYCAIVVLGAMGALLSVFISRMAGPDSNPHDDLSNRLSSYVRPLLGGLSAVVVVIVLESGVQSVITLGDNGVLIGALLAGFSERLIDRALGGMTDS